MYAATARLSASSSRYGFVDVVQALHLTPYLAAGRRMLSAVGRTGRPRPQPRATAPPGARGAGPDLHQVRPGAEHARRPAAGRRRRRALAAAGRRAAARAGRRGARHRRRARPAARRAVRAIRPDAARGGVDRPGPPRHAPSGEPVAIKVRRPGIAALIEADLAILADLAALAERHSPDAALYSLSRAGGRVRAHDPPRAGSRARRAPHRARRGAVRRRSAPCASPRFYWPLTTPAVLTMEFLDGVKVSAVGHAGGAGPGPHGSSRAAARTPC